MFATPYQVKDPAKTATKLASILGLDSEDVLKELADRQSGFAYIAHKVDLRDRRRRSATSSSTGSACCPTAAASIRRASSPRR